MIAFFFLGQKLFEANLRNRFTQESWAKLGKENKDFSPSFFSIPKYPIFKCVHDIFFLFFFPEDQTNQKRLSLGLRKRSLIGPK